MRTLALLFVVLPVAAAAEEPERRSTGRYVIELRLPGDGLVAGEENQVEFRVQDTKVLTPEGTPAPVLRARLRGEVDMPEMPGMARFEDIAHAEGIPGVYGVHPTFPHGGAYRLRLSLLPPAEQTLGMTPAEPEPFTVEFPLTVADTRVGRRSTPVRPYSLEVTTEPRAPRAGEPVEVSLLVRLENTLDRRPVLAFDPSHEKLLHLFFVRSDLGAFAHEHPVLGDGGVFRLTHTFSTAGRYMVFADTAPQGAGSQVLRGRVVVRGPAFEPFDLGTQVDAANARQDTVEGVTARLEAPAGGATTRRTLTLVAALSDAEGRPVRDLQPYLGALGHLMALHQDGETFVHSHPDEREPGAGRDGRIPFLARFPKAGLYRAWLQFQREGRVHTARFALRASDAE